MTNFSPPERMVVIKFCADGTGRHYHPGNGR